MPPVLVAEIAYDPDPIANGAGPGGSDKLAQRNLSISSANQELGVPSNPQRIRVMALLPRSGATDELLIDWGMYRRNYGDNLHP
jgi:hypothetical protein